MFPMPDLHDGFLDGLYLSENKCVYLFIRTLTGKRSTVVLKEVEALNVVNFRTGNIIFDVVFVEPNELTVQTIEQVYALQTAEEEIAARLVTRAQELRLSALEINSSYGAECTFLFASAELLPSHVLPQSTTPAST